MEKQAENKSGTVTSSMLKEVLDKYFTDVPNKEQITTEWLNTAELTTNKDNGEYKIKVSEIYDGKIEVVVSIPKGLEIGSIVNYNPNGTYVWQAEYCSSQKNINCEKTLKSGEGEEFNINIWRVFEIDEETGEVTLIPKHSTADGSRLVTTPGSVGLAGYQGYNNAVYLLNEACKNLYSESNKGIKARNISMKDIEGKMTEKALEEAHSYLNDAKYGEQVVKSYEANCSYYPSIYGKERLRSLEGGERINSGLEMNEQIDLIKSSDNGAIDGYLQGASLRPTQTYWYGDSNFMKSAFETAINGINYYDLLMPEGNNTYYWVSSRCIDTDNYNGVYTCYFTVRTIFGGNMDASFLVRSINGTDYDFYGLFPIVTLNAELIAEDSSGVFVVK